MIVVFFMLSIRIIEERVDFDAVAVKAITLTFVGIMLRTSFICENSQRKLSPVKYNES